MVAFISSIVGHYSGKKAKKEDSRQKSFQANLEHIVNISATYLAASVRNASLTALVKLPPNELYQLINLYHEEESQKTRSSVSLKDLLNKFLNPKQSTKIRSTAAKYLRASFIDIPVVREAFIKISKQEQNHEVRMESIISLGAIKHPTDDVIQTLLDILRDNHQYSIRSVAIHSLRHVGAKSEGVLQGLLQVIERSTPSRPSTFTILAVGELGVGRPEVVAALTPLLSLDKHTASATVKALGNVGIRTEEIMESLERFMRQTDEEVSVWATISLGKLGDKSVIPKLFKLLESSSGTKSAANIRREAGRALHLLHEHSV